MKNMLYETHMFEAMLRQTENYKTSKAAHQLLEKIIKRKCEKVMEINYGLPMIPGTVLHIADTEKWLIQPELKAIKEGLKYGK